MNDKNICVLIHGAIRVASKSLPDLYKKFLINNHHVFAYVHVDGTELSEFNSFITELGDRLKYCHIMNDTDIKNEDTFVKLKNDRMIDPYVKYPHHVKQWYKFNKCVNEMIKYENDNNMKYSHILRTRPDIHYPVIFKYDIDVPHNTIYHIEDFLSYGSRDDTVKISDLCDTYGHFDLSFPVPLGDYKRWMFASEIQLYMKIALVGLTLKKIMINVGLYRSDSNIQWWYFNDVKYICVDIGSYKGNKTVQYANNKSNIVFAVEPNPMSSRVMENQTKNITNCHVIRCALSDYNGSGDFMILGKDQACSSLLEFDKDIRKAWPRRSDFVYIDTVKVDVKTLKDVMIDCGIPHIDILYCEAQGDSLRILMGAGDYLSRIKEGYIKTFKDSSTKLYKDEKYFMKETVDFLKSNGFSVSSITPMDDHGSNVTTTTTLADANEVNIHFKKKYDKVITFGTFDCFHIGHVNILKRAKELGDYLIVGVSSDELSSSKGKSLVSSLDQRMEIVKNMKCVDEVFVEERLEDKDLYIKQYKADALVMGDDWKDKFDWVSVPCVYLPRTESVSTTPLKLNIMKKSHIVNVGVINPHGKHARYFDILAEYGPKYGMNFAKANKHRKFDLLVCFNRDDALRQNARNDTISVCMDHGCGIIKTFVGDARRYNEIDYFLTAGPDHTYAMKSYFGDDERIITAGYLGSSTLFSPPITDINNLRRMFNFNDDEIILYAPTYVVSDIFDHVNVVIKTLKNSGLNYIVSLHPGHNKTLLYETNFNTTQLDTFELIKLSDIVISDISSVLVEAASIGKKVIQTILKRYIDVPSSYDYDFPIIAGNRAMFLCGLPCKVENLLSCIYKAKQTTVSYFNRLYERPLRGTIINTCVIENIMLKLHEIAAFGTVKQRRDVRANMTKRNPTLRKTIVCSGGTINNDIGTNTHESVVSTLRAHGCQRENNCSERGCIIELDLKLLQDGTLAFLKSYDDYSPKGISNSASFSKCKWNNKYHTLTQDILGGLFDTYKFDVMLRLDDRVTFEAMIPYVLQYGNHIDKFIIQVHNTTEITLASINNIKKCMIVMDMYDILYVKELIHKAEMENIEIYGIIMNYMYSNIIAPYMDDTLILQSEGYRVYLQNYPFTVCQNLLDLNFGIIVHNVVKE